MWYPAASLAPRPVHHPTSQMLGFPGNQPMLWRRQAGHCARVSAVSLEAVMTAGRPPPVGTWGRVPGSHPPSFTQITRLPGQMSARCPVAASLHLPLGSAPQFEGLLVCFSGRQQRRSRQRKHSGVPLRVAWRSGLGSKAGPESSSRSGSYQLRDLTSLTLSLLNCEMELITGFS